MRFSRPFTIMASLLLFLVPAGPTEAQIISPGKLSEPHAELEGMRACTNCHRLREKGVEPTLCLDCHAPLRSRIEAGSGFHPATDAAGECARCHKEHFGREFTLIRWEPSEFEHSDIGWEPADAHARLDCRDCHTPEMVRSAEVRSFKGPPGALARTYLGLETRCFSCHQRDDPHDGQFSAGACDECHGQESWENPGGFDHDATAYPLTGRHRQIECSDCHRPQSGADAGGLSRAGTLTYGGLVFSQCSSCHVDEHEGQMAATCSACHVTSGWNRVGEEALRGRFDHDAVYPLEGAHTETTCSTCHGQAAYAGDMVRIVYRSGTEGRTYPSPLASTCLSCHLDEHDGEFGASAAGGVCDRCHRQTEWYPPEYDYRRHNEETAFPLEGAHLVTPCVACHPAESTAAVPGPRFRLATGAACTDCHAVDDPHGDQFEGRTCDSCHGNRTFEIDRFDHDATRYQLDGAHDDLGCADCHVPETSAGGARVVRYRPLGTECTDCHGGMR